MWRRSAMARYLAVAGIVLGVLGFPGTQESVDAYSATSQEKGFDTCGAPATSTMDNWWTSSPYWNIGIYIGGSNRGCAQPNLTASWVTHVQGTGWGLLPIWVGRQMPNPACQTTTLWNSYISTNTTTAYDQGYSEGQSALNAAVNLGMDVSSMPIIYDLEGYAGGTTCRNAAKSFLKGWADYLALAPAQKSGVYGSGCSSYIDDFYSNGNPPDFIFFGWWNGNPSTSNIPSCMTSSHWTNHQRHKQYVGGHTETYGGIKILIDNDCSDGPVYYTADRLLPSSPCL